VRISCEHCQAALNAPDSAVGKAVKCPKCGRSFSVPTIAVLEEADESLIRRSSGGNRNDEDFEEDLPRRSFRRGRFECPFCHTDAPPVMRQVISTGGWVVMIVLIFVCLPLFWIGFLIKEDVRYCSECGAKLP